MSYANNYSDEDTVSGAKEITFPWRPRELQVTNDSSTRVLQYKFNASESYRTLKPYETSTLKGISITSLFLLGNGDYRVWALG